MVSISSNSSVNGQSKFFPSHQFIVVCVVLDFDKIIGD